MVRVYRNDVLHTQLSFQNSQTLPERHLDSNNDSSTTTTATKPKTPQFTPVVPCSYPLAVRSPYLSAWLPGTSAASLPRTRPQFWTGQPLGWAVLGRVDGAVYNLFGVTECEGFVGTDAIVLSGNFTSTHTVFVLEAGGVEFTLDFFSPVSPKNYIRQSLPFSYLSVTAKVPSGKTHDVQVYSDFDASWSGVNVNDDRISYMFKTVGGVSSYQLQVAGAEIFEEKQDMALWGRALLAARQTASAPMTYSCGRIDSVRGTFAKNGRLTNLNGNWRNGGGNGFTPIYCVSGFSYDLGTVGGSDKTVQFAIGHVRDFAIQYLEERQTPYYRGIYPKAVDALVHFFDDYPAALKESKKLDETIEEKARGVAGEKYADICALSLRQTFGGMELTIPFDSRDMSGKHTMAWIKENSSNGNINTVDIIYPSFPLFYILNPEWIRLLLEPLLRYLDCDRFSREWAVHDMGRSYPLAVGHDGLDDEQMPIESSGNILIMIAAYTRATGNRGFLKEHKPLLESYANYLRNHGLHPAKQLSTNDAIGERALQTNLAVKAAVAMSAWGQICPSKPEYVETARVFAKLIHGQFGTSRDKTTGKLFYTTTYDTDDWFGVFNLYPDVLLGLNTFSPEALLTADETYVRLDYGVPLMGSVKWGKTDWQMFCAGAAVKKETRDHFVEDLHKFLKFPNTAPFSDRYWCDDARFAPPQRQQFVGGQYHLFRARPTLGAHFALLALEGPGVLGEFSGVP